MSSFYDVDLSDDDLGLELAALTTPFDIALPPANLRALDAPGQEVTMASVVSAPDSVGDDVSFSRERVNNLPLHRLEAWSEEKNPLAMGALTGRKTITYAGSRYTVRADEENIHWTVDTTYIDLLICVGGGLGLGPLLPNLNSLHTYRFNMDLGKPWRHFTAKYAKLGFDPTNAMLWIGQSASSEDVWLAFVPRSFIEGGEYNDEAAVHWRGPRSTTLSQEHYRCVVMLFASLLHSINFLDITLLEEFPDVTSDVKYGFATNLQ